MKLHGSTRVGLALLLSTAPRFAQDVTRESVASERTEVNDDAIEVTLSNGGAKVAIASKSSRFDRRTPGYLYNVFVRDRAANVTTAESLDMNGGGADGHSTAPMLSADGTLLVFGSSSTDLVPGDTNSDNDVFLRDLTAQTTRRVSVDGFGNELTRDSHSPWLAARSVFVAFVTAASIDALDSNGAEDVYLHDLATGVVELVSRTATGAAGDAASATPATSADGRFVVFQSFASDLVPGDLPGTGDVFLLDRASGLIERVSVDGNLVAFSSASTNLAPGGSSGQIQVYLRDRAAGTTTMISRAADGTEANDQSWWPAISADGSFVAFNTHATNLFEHLGGGNSQQLGILDQRTGRLRNLARSSHGVYSDHDSAGVEVAPDGSYASFASVADNLTDVAEGERRWDAHLASLPTTLPSASNYGAGFPGTHGIPSPSAAAEPVLGETLELDIGNSTNGWTFAFLLIGFAPTSIPTSLGGDLLVDFTWILPLPVPSYGGELDAAIPYEAELEAFAIYLQAIESDPGAAHGWSFTPGLEVVFSL